MAKKRKYKSNKPLISLLIVVVCALATYFQEQTVDPNTSATTFALNSTMSSDARVVFFDIGQGDSSLIIAGDDAILIDAGTNKTQAQMVSLIKSYGVNELDLIVASHPHEDHIGGIDYILDGMPVSALLMHDLPYNSITFADVLASAEANDVPILNPYDYDYFEFESGLILNVINPPEDFVSTDTNDDSIVCEVHIGGTSILYTGDMQKPLELSLLSSFSEVDILKSGHHGSSTSSTQIFLETINAKQVVISCALNNSYGHPHQEVLDRYDDFDLEIFRTDLLGDVVFDFVLD